MASVRFLFLLLLLPLGVIAAEVEVAVITLHNRPVSEVLPILRPHLEPDGGISGIGNQLVISSRRSTGRRASSSSACARRGRRKPRPAAPGFPGEWVRATCA